MRYLNKKINLSDYKSYINSLIPSYKDGIAIDIREDKNQVLYNTKSNHSMIPMSVNAIIGEFEGLWSWYITHELYVFFKNIIENKVCVKDNIDDYEEYLSWFNLTREDEDTGIVEKYFDTIDFKEEFISEVGEDENGNKIYQYHKLAEAIFDFVENGNESGNEYIKFEILDQLLPFNGCNEDSEKHTFIEIPLMINNSMDCLGQMSEIVDDWKAQYPYNRGNLVNFDNDVWFLDDDSSSSNASDTEIYKNGYTWNKIYRESVFGNLELDTNHPSGFDTYVERENEDKPWKKNIEREMEKTLDREIYGDGDREEGNAPLLAPDGSDFVALFGDKAVEKGDELDYAYKDRKFVANPTIKTMSDTYKLMSPNKGFIVYDNNVVFVEEYHYIDDFNYLTTSFCEKGVVVTESKKDEPLFQRYFIDFDCGVPFIMFSGTKIYGYEENGVYHFEYGNRDWVATKANGIKINGNIIFCEPSDTSISMNDGYTYDIIHDEYVVIKNIIYIYKSQKLYSYDVKNIINGYQFGLVETDEFGIYFNGDEKENTIKMFLVENGILYVLKPYNIHLLNYITGTTSSHLASFKKEDRIIDDLGSSIPGIFKIPIGKEKLYPGILRPIINDYVSLIYSEGDVNISTTIVEDEVYFGSYISSIDILVTAPDGSVMETDVFKGKSTGETLKTLYEDYTIEVVVSDDNSFTYKLSKPDNIKTTDGKPAKPLKEMLEILGSRVYCKIKYYIGAIIRKEKEGDGFKYFMKDGDFKGVEYVDEYYLERQVFTYNRSLTIAYPVFYFTMYPKNLVQNLVQGRDEMLDGGNIPSATFKVEIPIFCNEDGNAVLKDKELDETSTYFHDNAEEECYMDEYKNFMSSPLIHKEYYIGISSQENIEGNIYIDRGISSAFEKHLKLQEISSFKDLENYANGGFFTIR